MCINTFNAYDMNVCVMAIWGPLPKKKQKGKKGSSGIRLPFSSAFSMKGTISVFTRFGFTSVFCAYQSKLICSAALNVLKQFIVTRDFLVNDSLFNFVL